MIFRSSTSPYLHSSLSRSPTTSLYLISSLSLQIPHLYLLSSLSSDSTPLWQHLSSFLISLTPSSLYTAVGRTGRIQISPSKIARFYKLDQHAAAAREAYDNLLDVICNRVWPATVWLANKWWGFGVKFAYDASFVLPRASLFLLLWYCGKRAYAFWTSITPVPPPPRVETAIDRLWRMNEGSPGYRERDAADRRRNPY